MTQHFYVFMLTK